jgi:hypothetical protein
MAEQQLAAGLLEVLGQRVRRVDRMHPAQLGEVDRHVLGDDDLQHRCLAEHVPHGQALPFA